MKLQSSLLLPWVLLLSASCGPGPQAGRGAQERDETEIRRRVVAWLECDECQEGQLESVLQAGEDAVPSLIAALQGLSEAKRTEVRIELQTRYDDLRAYGASHPEAELASDRDEFVNRYLTRFEELSKRRAVIALGRIGGDEAIEALESALHASPQTSLARAIEQALAEAR